MKKIISITLCLIITFSLFSVNAFNVLAATSGRTGDCTWTLEGTELTISGTGAMGYYTYKTRPWGTDITKVTIKSGVTSIGSWAFHYCTKLASVSIGNSITSIGERAFEGCTSLASIEIPDSVTSIGGSAFFDCLSLASIVIPDSVTSIGVYAFSGCTGLKDIYYTGTKEQWDQLQGKPSSTAHYNICKNTNHIYDNDCDTTCNVCGYVRKISHAYKTTWSKNSSQHWHECSVCGDKNAVAKHIYDNDCDTTCNICGYVREISHSYKTTWSNDAVNHWYECKICYDKTDVSAHDFMQKYDGTYHWQECTVCGYKKDITAHVYDNSCDTTCNECNHTRTITHKFSTKWSASMHGHYHVCTVCGEIDEVISHVFDNDFDMTCNICGYKAMKIIANDVRVKVGNKVKVTVKITGNKGFGTLTFKMLFDTTKLKLESVDKINIALPENYTDVHTDSTIVTANTNGWYKYGFVPDLIDEKVFSDPVTYNGDIITFEFSVLEEASVGDVFNISIVPQSCYVDDENETDIAVAGVNGSITVIDRELGDTNGDGGIDDKDISALKRYLAGWNISVVESLLDINGDGTVDDKDANYLARSLAGWTGYEL